MGPEPQGGSSREKSLKGYSCTPCTRHETSPQGVSRIPLPATQPGRHRTRKKLGWPRKAARTRAHHTPPKKTPPGTLHEKGNNKREWVRTHCKLTGWQLRSLYLGWTRCNTCTANKHVPPPPHPFPKPRTKTRALTLHPLRGRSFFRQTPLTASLRAANLNTTPPPFP